MGKDKQVFDELQKAVQEIIKYVGKKNEIPTDMLLAVDALVLACQLLSEVVLDEALEMIEDAGCYDDAADESVCKKAVKALEKAEKFQNKAFSEYRKGRYDKALQNHRKVFQTIQKAVQKIEQDEEKGNKKNKNK
jgi:hypothetical protein